MYHRVLFNFAIIFVSYVVTEQTNSSGDGDLVTMSPADELLIILKL